MLEKKDVTFSTVENAEMNDENKEDPEVENVEMNDENKEIEKLRMSR